VIGTYTESTQKRYRQKEQRQDNETDESTIPGSIIFD
jgi:hypothetical protein